MVIKKKQKTININHVKPLITPDWTQKDGSKCFYQEGVVIDKEGTTSLEEEHTHSYTVDKNGNGETTEAAHHLAPQIHHKHQITGWQIRSSQSECYPHCSQQFGTTGSAPHIHSFVRTGQSKMLPPRYSVTIVTDYTSTGGSKLQDRMDEQVVEGVEKILKFYNKQNSATSPAIGWAEDWFIPERPKSKLKVLVSVPVIQLDSQPFEPVPSIESLPIPWGTIDLNLQNLKKRLEGAEQLLSQYSSALNDFYGTVKGVSLTSQAQKLSALMPALAALMLKNGYEYSIGRGGLLSLGITQDYKIRFVTLDTPLKKCNLYYGFNSFLNSKGIQDDRTIYFLSKLDRLYELYTTKEQIPWHDFFEEFILHPPVIDFSDPPRKSIPYTKAVDDLKEKGKGPFMSQAAFLDLNLGLRNPENIAAMQETLDSASDFVGDSIMTGLSNAGDWMEDIDAAYNRILNNLPFPNLIKAALECLGFQGFPGMDFLHLAKRFLNDLSMFAEEAAPLFKIPRSPLGYQLPTVDHMKDMFEQIGIAIAEALKKAFLQMVIEIIESILNACNECALQNTAAGRGRFDNLNFGGVDIGRILDAQTVMAGTMGVIQGLGSIQTTGTDRISETILEGSSREPGDPILSTADASIEAESHNSHLTKEEIENKRAEIQIAKEQFGSFLKGTSAVLTPGEVGNLLMGCDVGKDAIAAIQGMLSKFPAIKATLEGDGEDPDTVKAFFATMGKMTLSTKIIASVQDAVDNFEYSADCLCDVDDYELRKSLLEKKDDMTSEQIDEQIKKSDARYEKRLQELVANLDKNPLEDALPPIFCTIDPKTGLVKKGLMQHDHPTFDVMMDDVLDVCFNGIGTAFNSELATYFPSMETFPITKRLIPRTKKIYIPDYGNLRVLNPEFTEMVSQGLISYGSLPYEATKPIEYLKRVGDYDDDEAPSDDNNQKFLRDQGGFWSWFTSDDIRAQRAAVGLWESGQTKPTGEQEHEWELANISSGDSAAFAIRGGRHKMNDSADGDYTRKFGRSPIPVFKSEKGPSEFAPGLKESYEQFCTEIIEFEKTGAYSITRLNMPNQVLQNAGIDPSKLSEVGGSLGGVAVGGLDPSLMEASLEKLTKAFTIIGNSKIEVLYSIPLDSGLNDSGELTRDKYGISIIMQDPAGTYTVPVRANQVDDVPIHPKAQSSINYNSISIASEAADAVPQEKCFVTLLGKSWNDGCNIWRDGKRFADKEKYASGLKLPANITTDLKNYYYNTGSYTEIYKELMCSIGNQIGKSPFFDKKFLAALNLTPMRETGQSRFCVPHLLDIETLKARIKDEYSTVRCLDEHTINVDGKNPTKDNPFESACLGGAVLVKVRTFVAEYLLRSIFSFFYFRYRTAQDVDYTIVSYLSNKIIIDLKERSANDFGNFERASELKRQRELEQSAGQDNCSIKNISKKQTYKELFEEQTLNLYNRNVPKTERTTDFRTALDYLVRFQIWSVSNRLSSMANALGDVSLDAILLNEWLPTYDIPKSADEFRFAEPGGKLDQNSNRPYITTEEIRGFRKGYISDREMASVKDAATSIFVNNPVGWVYKYYFPEFTSPTGSKETGVTLRKQVWSQENVDPQTEKPHYTNTGQDGTFLSYSKKGGTNPLNSREWWLMQDAQDRTGANLNSVFPELSTTGSSTPLAWTYGISENERKGVQLLTRILSGINAISQPPGLIGTEREADPDYYIKIRDPANVGSPRGVNEIIAPGAGLMWWSFTHLKKPSRTVTLVPSQQWGGITEHPWNAWARNMFITNVSIWFKGPPQQGLERKATDDLYIWSPNRSTANIPTSLPVGTIWTDVFGEDPRYGQLKERVAAGHRARAAWGPPPQPGHAATFVNAPRFATIHGKTIGPWIWTNHTLGRNYQWVYIGKPGVTVDLGGYVYTLPVMGNQQWSDGSPHTLDFREGVLLGKLFDVARMERSSGDEIVLGEKWGEGFETYSDRTESIGMFNNAIEQLNVGAIPYLSLLDFDLKTAQNILVWERCRLEQNKRTLIDADRPIPQWLEDGITKYDKWITDWEQASTWIFSAHEEREKIRNVTEERMMKYPVQRRPMEEPLTKDMSNGNLIVEPYIRVKELPVSPSDLTTFAFPAEIIKNAKYVERNDNYLKGVVNIEKFENFIKSKFNPSVFPVDSQTGNGQPVSRAFNRIAREATQPPPPVDEECGPELTNIGFSRATTGEDVKFKLGHFFETISVGIRISHLPPPDDFSSGGNAATVFTDARLENADSYEISQLEKAYYVPEKNSTNGVRDLHIVPLASYEKSISMDTLIEDVFINPATNQPYTKEVREIVNGTMATKTEEIGFFRMFYENNAPLIIDTLLETDEYQLLFKYLFPLDRMLSLNNIYSAEYMTSYKDLEDSFDRTKEDIKYLFFALANSGNPYYDCGPSASDLMIALTNGLDVKGLAKMIALMIIKAALLIFKGFTEVVDPNIAMSKNILKLIRLTNKLIAAAQQMAQQAQEAGRAAANAVEALGDMFGDDEDCGESGQQDDMTKPPDKWFDPIDHHFLPDSPPLQTWMISLALLPVNLIPFIGIGPPVTPFAFPYWYLDLKPEPNWLNSAPPLDWLDDLFGKEANDAVRSVLSPPCDIDLGLSAPGSYDFDKDKGGE